MTSELKNLNQKVKLNLICIVKCATKKNLKNAKCRLLKYF